VLRYLLDTSTLSATIAAKPDASVVRRLSQRSAHCAIASVVWNELVYGCERLASGKRKSELEAFLNEVVLTSFPVLSYDTDAASWHGAERARLERAGKRAPYVDGQIAAIAVVNDLTLVTANAKDFAGFRELDVEDWTTSRAK
jgi:tRNA(fMet)-specific endonuclease VapC